MQNQKEYDNSERKRIVVRVSYPMYKAIRRYVCDNDTTIQDYMLQVITKELEQKGIEIQQ